MGRRPPAPLAWAGAAALIGAGLWPIAPGPHLPAVAGALACALLALGAPTLRVQWLCGLAGALLIGQASAGWRAPAPAGWVRSAHTVEVVELAGPDAHLRAATGEGFTVSGLWGAAPGDRLAALLAPAAAPAPLPGEGDPALALRRAGRARARVVHAAPLAGPPEPPDPFAGRAHRGLLRALALGDRAEVPADVKALLRRTGTAHLLAISGLHVGLVAGLGALIGRALRGPFAFTRVWRVAATLPPLMGLGAALAYGQVVGWPASAQRAGWMVAAATLARLLGRRPDGWSALGAAALALVLVDPGALGSLGLQLSLSAVLGILLIQPRVVALLPPDTPGAVTAAVGSLAVTLGATLGTLPLIAWRFQELPPTSLIANLIAGPVVSIGVVPLALMTALSPDALRGPVAALADASVDLLLALLVPLDADPITVAVGPLGAAALGVALLLRRRPLAAACLAVCGLTLTVVPRDRLEVTFLAVGQGDGAVVRWPDGRVWLIDGGPPGQGVLRWLRRQGITRLDAVFVSHAHPDHHGAVLPVLEALPVGALWLPLAPEKPHGALYELWRTAFDRHIPIRLPGDPGADVLHPLGFRGRGKARVNDESLVLRVEHGRHRFLFTGDIEARAEAWLAPRLGAVDVVKAPHHGSRTSSSPALARALDPRWVVISCGVENTFGHPHPEALGAWAGARLLRTDRDGTVRFRSDGEQLQLHRINGWGAALPLRRSPWRPRPPPGRGDLVSSATLP
jgi:competence protein ComEC